MIDNLKSLYNERYHRSNDDQVKKYSEIIRSGHHDNKGFTLAELLIVVAIIGVLVAIGIPVFTSQLEKARIAVDQSNVRAAKAAAAAEYMTTDSFSAEKTYYYSGGGTLVEASEKDSIVGYGKSNVQNDDGTVTGATGTPKDGYVTVTIKDDGTITAAWNGGGSSGGNTETTENAAAKEFLSKGGGDWRKVGAFNSGARIYDEDTGKMYIALDYVYFKGDTSEYSTMQEHYDHLSDDKKNDIAVIDATSTVHDYSSIQGTDTIIKRGELVSSNDSYYVAKTDTTAKSALADTSVYVKVIGK